jgi:hypothetical protein
VTDRGFRYGMSVFETLAVRRGRILFLHTSGGLTVLRRCGLSNRSNRSVERPEGLRMECFASMSRPGTAPLPPTGVATFAFFEPGEFPRPADVSRGAHGKTAPSVPVLGGWKTGTGLEAFAEARE